MTVPRTACDGSQVQNDILRIVRRTVFLKPNLRTRIGTHHEKTRYERCGTFPNQFTSSSVMLNSFAVAFAIAPNHTQFIPLTIFRSTYAGSQSTPLRTKRGTNQSDYTAPPSLIQTILYGSLGLAFSVDILVIKRRRRCSVPHARNSNKRSAWVNCITFTICFRLEFVHR